MKQFLLIFLICMLGGKILFAQQDKIFTQYQNYPMSLNSAYAGSRGTLQVQGIARRQWVGIKGAPRSLALSVNSPISFYSLGLGLTLEKDELGPEKVISMSLNCSHSIKLSESIKLNLGVKAELSNYNVNLSDLDILDYNDPFLMRDQESKIIPNFGIGTYLYSDNFFCGLSIPRLINTKIKGGQLAESSIDVNDLHYYFIGGYVYNINPYLKLKPSTLIKATEGARPSFDISLTTVFMDKFWLGASYRSEDSMGMIFQVNLNNQLKIGYAYDFPIGRLSGRTDGSHEISLSYDILFKSKKMKSPRYF